MLVAIAALLVGVLLGLLGGGGGIVTVPTLMYIAGLPPKEAVPNCLVILSVITAFSALQEWRAGRLQIKGTILFALFGTLGSLAGARISIQYIPEHHIPLLFVGTVLVAALLMIRKSMSDAPARPLNLPVSGRYALLWAVGFTAGFLGSVVGVGGGFLMVPALNLIAGYPMTIAVGTNLLIIAVNSMVGALGYKGSYPFHMELILIFVGLGIVGSLYGSRLRAKASEKTLKLAFGVFLLGMSILIIGERFFE